MKLSTRSRYGVRLMIALSLNYEKGPLQLSQVSENEEISEKYLGQIVIQLKNSGLITSVRGAQGGYLLPRTPRLINLEEIVTSLEGEINLGDDSGEINNNTKTSKLVSVEVWDLLTRKIKETLKSITLEDLTEKVRLKNNVLNYSI